jgi:hypothetical protein
MADQPTSCATMLSSIAAILSAIAWPGVVAWFLINNRIRIADLLKVFGDKLSSAKKLRLGQFELEEDLQEAISEAGARVDEADTSKTVPKNQRQAAENLKKKVIDSSIPKFEVLEAVGEQIYDLADQYEDVRAHMRSGAQRTRKMNEIAAGMRTLALAGLPLRTKLTRSEKVGHRLAAICMLQVEPRPRYFRWLIERLENENQAFVLFQAALALLELVKKRLYINVDETRSAISDAIAVISAFKDGPPDQNTLDALNEALELVRQ